MQLNIAVRSIKINWLLRNRDGMRRLGNNKGKIKLLALCLILGIGILIFFLLYPDRASSGTYLSTAHGNSTSGVNRQAVTITPYPDASPYPVGHCGHCHEMHASVGGDEPTPPTKEGASYYAVFRTNYGATNKNELCYACHETFNFTGTPDPPLGYGRYYVYQGKTIYTASVHNISTSMVWPTAPPPGPTYNDYGNCHNCHNPHGYTDGTGLIPNMVFKREEPLCNECHDGSPVLDDIKTLVTSAAYRHKVAGIGNYSNIHQPGFSQETRSYLSANKHVECVDCHNPHVAKAGTNVGTQTNLASNASQGSPAVNPTWPAAWTAPSTWSEGFIISTDATFKYEWQICFRCHSSYNTSLTTWNANWTDIAVEFNPSNGSYHSVIQLNPNRNVSATYPPVFVSPWTKDSLMMCSDCHTNNAGNPYGPHGSTNAGILIDEYDALTGYTGTSGDLCFNCHQWAAYTGWTTTTAKTGFYGDGKNLHVYHVSDKEYSCTACHLARPHGGAAGSKSQSRGLLLWDPTGTGNLVSTPYRGAMNKKGTVYAYNSGSAEYQYVITWRASGAWIKNDCRIEYGNNANGGH